MILDELIKTKEQFDAISAEHPAAHVLILLQEQADEMLPQIPKADGDVGVFDGLPVVVVGDWTERAELVGEYLRQGNNPAIVKDEKILVYDYGWLQREVLSFQTIKTQFKEPSSIDRLVSFRFGQI